MTYSIGIIFAVVYSIFGRTGVRVFFLGVCASHNIVYVISISGIQNVECRRKRMCASEHVYLGERFGHIGQCDFVIYLYNLLNDPFYFIIIYMANCIKSFFMRTNVAFYILRITLVAFK